MIFSGCEISLRKRVKLEREREILTIPDFSGNKQYGFRVAYNIGIVAKQKSLILLKN